MSGRRELKSIGAVGNALYTQLPKLTVVTQGVILCPVDSGLGKNLEVQPF